MNYDPEWRKLKTKTNPTLKTLNTSIKRKKMKNKLPTFSIMISLAALLLTLFLSFKNEKTVYVDSMKLLSQYKGTLKAKAEYEKKATQWKANVDTLTIELNEKITQYEKEKGRMTLKEKKLTEELLTTKQQDLERYRAAVTENAAKEDQLITTQVFKEIGDFVKQYGEGHGYDYVLGATSMGNIVYAAKGKNITDEVLKELNAGYRDDKK